MRFFLLPLGVSGYILSREIYKLMYPEGADVKTTHAFSTISMPGKPDCISIDESYPYPIFQKSNTDMVLLRIAAALREHLQPAEATTLADKIRNSERLSIVEILPSAFTEVDNAYLVSEGYIPVPPSRPY